MLKTFLIVLLSIPVYISAEYKNTNGEEIDKSLKDLIRWQRNQKKPILSSIDLSDEWKLVDFEKSNNFMIWIGHSTFLIKKNNLVILTDPVFSERASPFKRLGPKRLIPPAISLNELPKIDVVTISHNHYDHLDIRSLKKLSKLNPNLIFLIPKGDIDIFNKKNIDNVKEFVWWEEISIDDFIFTFTPVQHWSARGLFDRNESLWGGWFIKSNDYSLYHAGDTGYSNDFIETQKRLGSPKYAFLPIGAYDPEWFMAASHVNPEDSIRIMKDLGAEFSFGMHWGTFTLTAEDTLEPPQRLKEALNNDKLDNFITLKPGEVVYLQ
ncbi:MAG: MBL fold metallo-hydrolase [Gammaproteobacteria bacterium]